MSAKITITIEVNGITRSTEREFLEEELEEAAREVYQDLRKLLKAAEISEIAADYWQSHAAQNERTAS